MNLRAFIKKEEIIHIAKNLVAIDSHKKELEAAIWIKEFLDKEGIESRIDEIEEDRPNVYGKIEGEDDGVALMFNGHTDVVPGLNMEYDPFKPFIKDGKLYGRGSVDMKGGIAAMLAAITAVKRANVKLRKGVMFAGVIDEEERSLGTERIIKNNIKADMVVIAEPTQLQVTVAHKGVETIEVVFKGKAGHASRPREGINAIYTASEFIKLVHDELEPMIEAKKFELLDSGSICVSIIQGGNTGNVIPDICTVILDRRWLPSETMESIYDEVKTFARMAVDRIGGSFETRAKREVLSSMGNVPHNIDKESILVREALKIVKKETGIEQKPVGFSGWTDAALLSNHGKMDCIILGPGNTSQAHASDEYCEIDQIVKATYIYIRLIEKFCMEGELLWKK